MLYIHYKDNGGLRKNSGGLFLLYLKLKNTIKCSFYKNNGGLRKNSGGLFLLYLKLRNITKCVFFKIKRILLLKNSKHKKEVLYLS
ncbi:MAG: hypothetical protein LBD88_04025 [Candidatus Peribacteria bacterium]|jgi:hypothetical protein|nr:hypothetical protein [Candidatus Peribacteria bacterium]